MSPRPSTVAERVLERFTVGRGVRQAVTRDGRSEQYPVMADDVGRRLVAERDLTAAAVAGITPLMDNVDFTQLGQLKRLLKQFFSAQPWGPTEDAALADTVGSGHDSVDHLLAP